MLTGEIRSQIDAVWNAFWAGGISNPLEVIEQITYLLFLKRLDDLHTLEENKSTRLKRPMERRIFPGGDDPKGRPYEDMRWSRLKNRDPATMFAIGTVGCSEKYSDPCNPFSSPVTPRMRIDRGGRLGSAANARAISSVPERPEASSCAPL